MSRTYYLASFPGSPPRMTTTIVTVHRRHAGGEPGNEAYYHRQVAYKNDYSCIDTSRYTRHRSASNETCMLQEY